MQGYINGIWLAESGGKLHPAICSNLRKWADEAVSCNFGVVLWTNLAELDPNEVEMLSYRNIIVNDHSVCATSNLYEYFLFFLNMGINGDKTAFALASDVLRMAILELADKNEYFIYADPNDVLFLNLKDNLSNLQRKIGNIPFGFSFYVEQINEKLYHTRNDVLIAHKCLNPNFFKDYLAAYLNHIKINHTRYFMPTSDAQAQKLAREISCQTGDAFFKILLRKPYATVRATFGKYECLYPIVNILAHLPHERNAEYSNTWLPLRTLVEEKEQLRLLGVKSVDFPSTIKPVVFSSGSTEELKVSDSKNPSDLPSGGKLTLKKGFLL